jgi:AraC-like DNA-binding protein
MSPADSQVIDVASSSRALVAPRRPRTLARFDAKLARPEYRSRGGLISFSARGARSRNVMADLVSIPLVLFDRLRTAGLDVDLVLRRAKLQRSRFNVPNPQGTADEFFALWRAVEETAPDANLGLRLGSTALTDFENVAVLAALHSATLGEGLRKLARYKRLVCPEKVSIDVGNGEARIRFEWLFANDEPPPLVTDLIFSGVVSLAQRGTKTSVRPLRVELTRRRVHAAILRRHFRCEVRFDAPRDVLVFDEASLDLPMVHRNAQLLAILVPGLELAAAQAEEARSLADDVRLALGDAMSGDRPLVGKIAKSLGLSARTMQRRLGELGTTYQELLDDVRHQSARRLLAKTDLPMGDLAFLLGFEEVNSFVRAFQGWEGASPAKWRENAAVAQKRARPMASTR